MARSTEVVGPFPPGNAIVKKRPCDLRTQSTCPRESAMENALNGFPVERQPLDCGDLTPAPKKPRLAKHGIANKAAAEARIGGFATLSPLNFLEGTSGKKGSGRNASSIAVAVTFAEEYNGARAHHICHSPFQCNGPDSTVEGSNSILSASTVALSSFDNSDGGHVKPPMNLEGAETDPPQTSAVDDEIATCKMSFEFSTTEGSSGSGNCSADLGRKQKSSLAKSVPIDSNRKALGVSESAPKLVSCNLEERLESLISGLDSWSLMNLRSWRKNEKSASVNGSSIEIVEHGSGAPHGKNITRSVSFTSCEATKGATLRRKSDVIERQKQARRDMVRLMKDQAKRQMVRSGDVTP